MKVDVFDSCISENLKFTESSYEQQKLLFYTNGKNANASPYSLDDLLRHKEGYELSENGEILELPENGLENLFVENLPIYDPDNVEQRVESAIKKFRSYRSSLDEKHDAIRDLADVLEFLRPKIKELAEKSKPDEQYLYKFTENTYDIANNCGIRHHNNKQKQDYDKDIWYNWIFYYYLATIHTFVRLIKKAESQSI